jgi:hypothetical protein
MTFSTARTLCESQPDWTAGLAIDTTVTLADSEGLGSCVAELNSSEQAAFLIGLTEAFAAFPPSVGRPGHMQCAYIADQFKGSPGVAAGVLELLDTLASHIREVI